MYTYKIISIPHNMWTGKPEENIEAIINHHGKDNWRYVEMKKEMNSTKFITTIIMEKAVDADYYLKNPLKPLPSEYKEDDFV